MKCVKAGNGFLIKKEDYSKEIIFHGADLPDGGHLLQVVTIPPQTKQRSHFHDFQTEVFYVLEGECFIYLNDEEYLAKPGDAFVCSPGDRHNLWNKTNQDFKLAVFKINLPKEDDTHWSNL